MKLNSKVNRNPETGTPLPAGMKHDLDLMRRVFLIQNPSLNEACNRRAVKKILHLVPESCTVQEHKGNIIVTKGDPSVVRPFYLAHIDQVHRYRPYMQVRVSKNVLHALDGNGERCGVGGDDKCGVYLNIMMLRHFDNVSAVFVRDEEVGCIGSSSIPLDWFDNAAFVLQADRRNDTMDIIRETNGMICASDEFMSAILNLPIAKAAGHQEACGSVTDIGELASRGLPISAVNVSSGYHFAHTSDEVVLLDELAVCLELARQAGGLLGNKIWQHEPVSAYMTGREDGTYWQEYEQELKEKLIAKLVDQYQYDRHFYNLDAYTLDDLEYMLEELDFNNTDEEL